MDNLILDISDPKKVFIEKFIIIYTSLGDSIETIPIVYGNHIIYFSKKCTHSIVNKHIKRDSLKNITLIYPNRMLCLADVSLKTLANGIYVLLNYYKKTVDINSIIFKVDFDILGVKLEHAKYSDCD